MNRAALQRMSKTRVREASTLLRAGLYLGSYYLIGYAVECALKAYVAKQVRRYDFPDKKLANEAFTHDLEKLVRVAGLIPILERDMRAARALR
jgi:HEPN domain-containing protein